MKLPRTRMTIPMGAIFGAVIWMCALYLVQYRRYFGQVSNLEWTIFFAAIFGLIHGATTGLAVRFFKLGKIVSGLTGFFIFQLLGLTLIAVLMFFNKDLWPGGTGYQNLRVGNLIVGVGLYWSFISFWAFFPSFAVGFLTTVFSSLITVNKAVRNL